MNNARKIECNFIKDLPKLLHMPKKHHNKYTRGLCIIAGAPINMSGASILAAKSAMKSGTGIVKLFSNAEAMPIYAAALPAVVKKGYSEFESTISSISYEHSAILIGPGAGQNGADIQKIIKIVAKTKAKLVLDADALNAFEGNVELLSNLVHKNTIITPHEGEFARLFPKLPATSYSKHERTLAAAKSLGCTVVLKGNDTVVATPGAEFWRNEDSPTNLATAGSGDVLAGMITAFLSQNLNMLDAAALAVAVHSECARNKGFSMNAEDLINSIAEFLNSKVI